MRPPTLLFLLLLFSVSTLAVSAPNGSYCESYGTPGLVFPGANSRQTLSLQKLCFTFGADSYLNVSIYPYVQTTQIAIPVVDYLKGQGFKHVETDGSVPISGALSRYDLSLQAVITGVGAPTQIELAVVNNTACVESSPSFCCPLCDGGGGAYLLNLASGAFALEVVYYPDNSTKSIGLAPYDSGSRNFFDLPYSVSLACTTPGSCNRLVPSSVVTGSINGLPGGDVWWSTLSRWLSEAWHSWHY